MHACLACASNASIKSWIICAWSRCPDPDDAVSWSSGSCCLPLTRLVGAGFGVPFAGGDGCGDGGALGLLFAAAGFAFAFAFERAWFNSSGVALGIDEQVWLSNLGW